MRPIVLAEVRGNWVHQNQLIDHIGHYHIWVRCTCFPDKVSFFDAQHLIKPKFDYISHFHLDIRLVNNYIEIVHFVKNQLVPFI